MFSSFTKTFCLKVMVRDHLTRESSFTPRLRKHDHSITFIITHSVCPNYCQSHPNLAVAGHDIERSILHMLKRFITHVSSGEGLSPGFDIEQGVEVSNGGTPSRRVNYATKNFLWLRTPKFLSKPRKAGQDNMSRLTPQVARYMRILSLFVQHLWDDSIRQR